MKLNILSHSLGRERILGANKVLQNTLKGLSEIGVEYCFNEPIYDHEYNWIHDAPEGIIEAGFSGRPVLVGPNTATMPRDLPRFRRPLHPASIYLFPSFWPMKAWTAMGYKECRIEVWSAGIDLLSFPSHQRLNSDPNQVLVYFKHRDEGLLRGTLALLQEQGYSYEVFHYGSYKEAEYQAALGRSKAAIWLGGTESQGFALMEAMATGLPILVLDARSLADNVHDQGDPLVPRFPVQFIASGATTAPYFNQYCGIKIASKDLNIDTLKQFMDDVEAYDPTTFIRAEHSLSKAAERLIGFAKLLPKVNARISFSQPQVAKGLRYLDLIPRTWAWRLAWCKLLMIMRKK
jgi:hypothetical protein